MQKKHAFSPNHKVVTDSKHNFSSHGAPSTASMGQPPQSVGGGGGEQPGGDSDGASMGGMNFCNGGKAYADGGDTDESFHAIRDVGRQMFGGGSTTTVHPKDDSSTASSAAALSPAVPGGETVAGRKSQIDNAVEDASK
jgi:hypothetical protein